MASLRISVLFLGILLAGIGGCGKTGPLYLPADPATEVPHADAPASPATSPDNNN
jgi:predicted small lipoprotein YifL